MKFGPKTVTEYNTAWKIRAYVKLANGRIFYTGVVGYSIFNVASSLYNNCLMQNKTAHDYLYDSILTKVNPTYSRVDYKWGNGLVK